jgi:hypothetical protein
MSSTQRPRTPIKITEIFPQSTAKYWTDLSWHSHWWERFDQAELGLEALAIQTFMAMMHSTQPHWIALKWIVVLDSPIAHMSSQYLYGTARPATAHTIHEVFIRGGNGELQPVCTLIDCAATSIFMALRLRERPSLADEAAYITTLGLRTEVTADASNSWTTMCTVQYMDHLSPVQDLVMLVVTMRAYNLDWGSPELQSRNREVNWQCGRLLYCMVPCAHVVECAQAYMKVCLYYGIMRHHAPT